MTWKVEPVPELDGFTVEWAAPGRLILSRRNELFEAPVPGTPVARIAAIEAPGWKALAARLRPLQRLLRFSVTNVVPMPDGSLFVTFDRSAGIVRDGRFIPVRGLARDCRVLRGACASDTDGSIYFGEYLANDDRGPMRVYRLRSGETVAETALEFAAGEVRHVHGVYFDEFDPSLVCLTGDLPAECRMLRSRDGFRTTEAIGSGDETWRAVSVQFSADALWYGMDAEHRTNHIYRLDRRGGERRVLGEVSGTVFYSKKVGDEYFFATTAENAPSQKENVAAIWNVGADGSLSEVAKFPKDRWHGTLFQFGTIQFPYFSGFDDQLYFSVVAAEGDGRCFRLVRDA